jgi:hypothetical protein
VSIESILKVEKNLKIAKKIFNFQFFFNLELSYYIEKKSIHYILMSFFEYKFSAFFGTSQQEKKNSSFRCYNTLLFFSQSN